MKNMNMLVWLTQLGISVALPLGGFIWLAAWLRSRFDMGGWIIVVAAVLGALCAIRGLRTSLQAMERMVKNKNETEQPISFNDHD